MEDILNKNIFDDKILQKLSPDYSPSNILLRMQMRRTMARDTHSHGNVPKSDNWQRKTIKRGKDYPKVNKEIVKMRNVFDNINLRNKVLLNNTIKNIDSIPPKDLAFTDNNVDDDADADELVKLNHLYLDDVSDNVSNLVVCSDTDFKINNKPRVAKLHTEIKTRKILKKTAVRCNNLNGHLDTNSIDLSKDLLRIECKYNESFEFDVKEVNTSHEMNQAHATDIDIEQTKSRADFDKQVNDLQTLLIMMAISPKSNENEDVDFDAKDRNITDCSDLIEVKSKDFPAISNNVQSDDFTQFLNVTPLRIVISDRQNYILRKYVDKWKIFVVKRREHWLQQRQTTLNSFFDKIAKKKMNTNQSPEHLNKAKKVVRDYKTYQHRYKVQRHIIALQKAKLEEQNRMIEELKYNKIVEASRQSVDAIKEDVRKTYFEIDRQLKPKIKCLTNELKLHDIEDPALILHCMKVPQFIQRMEKRAREREEKHAMIRERRKQMEEERLRLKQQEELAKAEMDKEEKMKRMIELKEKRKREKIENIRKKQLAERMRALTVMADLHYERNLKTKYGIRPLRVLVEIKRDNMEKAKAHYTFQIKKNVFLHWMWHTEDMWFERNYIAEDFHRKKLLTNGFVRLKQNHHGYVLKKQVADDYYDFYVTKLVFRKFKDGIEIVRKEQETKWQKVVTYYSSNLLFKTFTSWRTLPALNALKREQEVRKARWREKVLQVVPDYIPPED